MCTKTETNLVQRGSMLYIFFRNSLMSGLIEVIEPMKFLLYVFAKLCIKAQLMSQ